jgi:RimJ/RimL family protein N-acetyltransferase
MKLYRFEDVIEFYNRTQSYLLQHEAEHYILLGFLEARIKSQAYRQNGYATAAVAAVSQLLLDRGCKFCYLTTNLKNSTSNRVYQTVGYQTYVNAHRYTFE